MCVYSSSTLPNVLSINSSLSHPPASPRVSDVCVFGSKSGLPACSHMLFYPSVASGAVSPPPSLSPPPASLSPFGWPCLSIPPSCLCGCPPPSVCLSAQSCFLAFVRLRGKGGVCLSSPLPCSLIPPSERKTRKEGVSARELKRSETKWPKFPLQKAVLVLFVTGGSPDSVRTEFVLSFARKGYFCSASSWPK